MGRLDLPDKRVDWVSVTTEYLAELRNEHAAYKQEVDRLTHEVEELEDNVGTLLALIGPKGIYRRKAA